MKYILIMIAMLFVVSCENKPVTTRDNNKDIVVTYQNTQPSELVIVQKVITGGVSDPNFYVIKDTKTGYEYIVVKYSESVAITPRIR